MSEDDGEGGYVDDSCVDVALGDASWTVTDFEIVDDSLVALVAVADGAHGTRVALAASPLEQVRGGTGTVDVERSEAFGGTPA
ncbi:hypothetical protein ACXET9_10705 [Brachybacterium sp. DNPG3]